MIYSNILELLDKLDKEHKEGEFLYRGQNKRHDPHQWTAHGEVREVEALYPSDFRFHYKAKDFSPENADRNIHRITAIRSYGRTVRDQFITFLVALLMSEEDEEIRDWAFDQFPELIDLIKSKATPQNSIFYRMAWSLAQHYAVATALTDVTYSTKVAAWFATERWNENDEPPKAGNKGVIYRIKRNELDSILAVATQISRQFSDSIKSPSAPEMFLVDIRNIPSKLARRPIAQQGASIYGFDQPHVIAAAIKGGAIEVFEFEHQPGLDIGINRNDVIPEEDSFLTYLERFNKAREHLIANEISSKEERNELSLLLEQANTSLNLGITTAREVEKLEIDEQINGIILDKIQRRGEIEFLYVMLIVLKEPYAVLGAITAENMKLMPGLTPEMMESVGFGGHAVRVWFTTGSRPTGYGNFKRAKEFVNHVMPLAGQSF